MATIGSLNALLIEQLRDIYDAEKRLTKAIPKMRKAATNVELRRALADHLSETEQHVARLERAFNALDEKARAKPCAGMKGLILEGEEHARESYEGDDLRDAAIIGSTQRVEHYEIAVYGTVIAHARLLGNEDVAGLLHKTLEEEKAADERLTEIAERVVNIEAATNVDEEAAVPGSQIAVQRASSRRRSSTTMQRAAVAADSTLLRRSMRR